MSVKMDPSKVTTKDKTSGMKKPKVERQIYIPPAMKSSGMSTALWIYILTILHGWKFRPEKMINEAKANFFYNFFF